MEPPVAPKKARRRGCAMFTNNNQVILRRGPILLVREGVFYFGVAEQWVFVCAARRFHESALRSAAAARYPAVRLLTDSTADTTMPIQVLSRPEVNLTFFIFKYLFLRTAGYPFLPFVQTCSSAPSLIMSTSSTPKASSEASSPRLSASVSSHSSAPPSEDPSVIVGLACRVPGAQNYRQLWDHIVAQKDMRRKMPENRFNVDTFFHADGANKGTVSICLRSTPKSTDAVQTNSKWGYFLEQDIGNFDPGFFGISGAEAEAMDPQQRLLLEVVYEALEDAGITLDGISGTQTSVYCGSFTNDYNAMTTKDLAHYPKYTVTGTGNAILSNRISYFYNLHGPSVTVDTACSSSLVCFHLGNRSLHDKEADISIVVGSSLHFDPNIFITMTDLGMLSTDGRCRAFDEKGSGYVRGEGICAVVLKRRSDAELSGDRIRAVVRTTGVNHDGRKQGITYPNTDAQEALIRATYENAGLDPAETQYFEAHGTGTKAGDPNETRAIGAVFSPNRTDNIIVGSVKTNIGHLEGASGLAAVVKTTMALEKAQIPPNMHFEDPNPAIKFSDWKITVPQKLMDWKPGPNGTRRASIK